MPGRSPLIPLLGLAGFLLLSACAGPAGLLRRVSNEEWQAYEAALSQIPDDRVGAGEGLESFLQAWPESELADDAAERLARLAFEDGRTEDAFRWLYYVVDEHPGGDRIDSVRLRLARWESERGDREKALELVERVRASRLRDRQRRAMYRLLADLSEDPVERLGHLAQLRRLVQAELEALASQPDSAAGARARSGLKQVDGEIDALLQRMSRQELERAVAGLRARVPAAAARLMLAERSFEVGDFEHASSLLNEAERHDLSAADREWLASLQRRLGLLEGPIEAGDPLPTFREAMAFVRPALDGAVGTIGVVLPLSGRFASFGEESLRGVLLAAGVFDAELPPPPPVSPQLKPVEPPVPLASEANAPTAPGLRLVVRDTRGDAARAVAAVRGLAGDDEVSAIVGPIFSAESEAAAQEAQSLRVPLLTLSNREQISTGRDYVYRLRTVPDDEVGFLVDYAVDVLGAERFAVLYPKSRYGRGMRKRYWEAVLERDGKMVATASYEPDATDFSEPIRSMIGYSLLTDRERVALQERADAIRRGRRLEPEQAALLRQVLYSLYGPERELLPPLVDFDALFIPDSHEKIQLIAPQLAFHEIEDIQLLGSSEWNHPDLVRIARKHVRGAVISTSFHLESEFEFVRSFVEAYRLRFGSDPGVFAAHAFDAANLVVMQIAARRNSRPQVRDGILRVRGYPGVSGVISMLPDGNASKRPFLLGVKRRGIIGLD